MQTNARGWREGGGGGGSGRGWWFALFEILALFTFVITVALLTRALLPH